MNNVNVLICVIPAHIPDLVNINDFCDPDLLTSVRSGLEEIKFNKVGDSFVVVYDDATFQGLSPASFSNSVISILKQNLQNTIFTISIKYSYLLNNEYQDILFNAEAAKAIISVANSFRKIGETDEFVKCNFGDEFVSSVIEPFNEYVYNSDEYDDDQDEEEDDIEEDDDMFIPGMNMHIPTESDESDFDDLSELQRIVAGVSGSSGKHKKKKGSRTKKTYSSSKVIANANNPKKSYNRHGIIIAADKDDIRRDEKMLKSFLKEFIPGSQDWKKDLRKDLLNRWMRSYCITKKEIKKLEKDYQKKRRSKRSSINTDKTLEFTKRLFTVPIDSWNNPNK